MKHNALGLMSGTSADGVSIASVSFEKKAFRIEAYRTFPYPKEIANRIKRAPDISAPEISDLNFRLGRLFADCALKFLKDHKLGAKRIAVIGSHGQTIYHAPRGKTPSTLQIGEPSFLAERTGMHVVSDFRPRDIVLGGEGAPLIPFFDHHFFGDGPIRAFQNIGGIANVTLVGRGLKPVAFDTGPGNCLIDWAVKIATRERQSFDKNGAMAAGGGICMEFVRKMMRHPYFSQKPPKSTGWEVFNAQIIPEGLKRLLKNRPHDAIATLTYFTAESIYLSYKNFLRQKPVEVVISGGGALNRTLMGHLTRLFFPTEISSIEKFGLPAQAKEPVAFAFFALCAILGKSNHLPEGTGARRPSILGKITPGKNFTGLSGLR